MVMGLSLDTVVQPTLLERWREREREREKERDGREDERRG